MSEGVAFSEEYQHNLEYYKDKVDGLERQRQAWLAKFDECESKLKSKHQKQNNLRNLKDDIDQKQKDIIHHQIARLDEQLSSLNMDRQNQNLEFEEAEQLVKMRQLVQQNPIILQKQIPCLNSYLSSQLINNQLNIHSNSNKNPSKTAKKSANISSKSSNSHYCKTKSSKIQGSAPKSLQNLLRLKIIEARKLNEQQIQLLNHQKQLLKEKIHTFKQSETNKVDDERKVVKQFKKKYKDLEKTHKQLAEAYFQFRRTHKKKFESTCKQNQILKEKYDSFEKKVQQQIKTYEKQNKAKQALIFRKAEDFKQNYKAKMRAKQRNLQALKQNYQKMQQICIEKVRKLEATLEKSQNHLRDSQQRRKFIVQELREELRNLQKKSSEQLLEKARLDLRLKKKMEQQQALQNAQKQRQQKAERLLEKQSLIKSAYKKTRLPSAKNKRKTVQNWEKSISKKAVNNAQQQDQSEDDSLNMSDLQKIQKQINTLQKKIDQN